MKRDLTNREKAALYAKAAGLFDDWVDVYRIASEKSTKEINDIKFLSSSVSRWKNVPEIAQYYEDCVKRINDQAADQRQQAREDERRKVLDELHAGESVCSETKEGVKVARIIDYSDPENRKRLYNDVIAKSKDDPKTQLDAAKMFEQIQKEDKQAAREQKQVRFYLAQRCSECPLYEKARQKAEKG